MMRGLGLGALVFAAVLLAANLCDGLKIAAFKVQVLGPKKIKNQEVVNVLVQIVRRYDVIFLQDIRDVSGEKVLPTLLAEVNNGSEYTYQYQVSGNLGRTKQKARYAYLYRNETVEVWDTYQYEDPDDSFEREPFSILISCKTSDTEELLQFFLLGVHVKPASACSELDALWKAYEYTSHAFNNITDGLVLGNLNADCRYLSGCPFQDLEIVSTPQVSWLIDFSVDTTTTPTYCAYDRIIAVGDIRQNIDCTCSGQVYRFDTDLSLSLEEARYVSDHYPVEVEIKNRAKCLHTIVVIVAQSSHSQAHSKGPHNLWIATTNRNVTYILQDKHEIPNKLEFDVEEDFGFTDCLELSDIQSISIVPESTDEWMLVSVVSLAYDYCGKVTLLTDDSSIDFTVDLDNRGSGKPLQLTLV